MDKNDLYLEKTLMNKWEFLEGDINFMDYGGKWFKHIQDNTYHVIELINWYDATGEIDQNKYNVGLQEIDLDSVDIESALECCGWLDQENEIDTRMKISAVSSYGQFAPMGNWDSNNYRKLLKQAKLESDNISQDNDYHSYMLDRPVNQLGSTACEFARGDFTSAMIRGIAEDNPMHRLMGKIHGLSNEDMDQVDESLSDFTLHGDCQK